MHCVGGVIACLTGAQEEEEEEEEIVKVINPSGYFHSTHAIKVSIKIFITQNSNMNGK